MCLLGHISHFFGAKASWIHTFHTTQFHLSLCLFTLLGPGRQLIIEGMKSLVKGAPNMNTLVGLGALSSFTVSSLAALIPKLVSDASINKTHMFLYSPIYSIYYFVAVKLTISIISWFSFLFSIFFFILRKTQFNVLLYRLPEYHLWFLLQTFFRWFLYCSPGGFCYKHFSNVNLLLYRLPEYQFNVFCSVLNLT